MQPQVHLIQTLVLQTNYFDCLAVSDQSLSIIRLISNHDIDQNHNQINLALFKFSRMTRRLRLLSKQR